MVQAAEEFMTQQEAAFYVFERRQMVVPRRQIGEAEFSVLVRPSEV
jgi:hypothetical protein